MKLEKIMCLIIISVILIGFIKAKTSEKNDFSILKSILDFFRNLIARFTLTGYTLSETPQVDNESTTTPLVNESLEMTEENREISEQENASNEVISEEGSNQTEILENKTTEEDNKEINKSEEAIKPVEIIAIDNSNETEEIVSLEKFFCKNFEEDILWSSGYTNNESGSTKYYTWNLKNNCPKGENGNCILTNVKVNTRVIYSPSENNSEKGEGYIQISKPDESTCENPSLGIYSKYLAYETLQGEDKKLDWNCGDNKNFNSRCGVNSGSNYNGDCYGIKAYSSQYFLLDAFKINYSWCWKNE